MLCNAIHQGVYSTDAMCKLRDINIILRVGIKNAMCMLHNITNAMFILLNINNAMRMLHHIINAMCMLYNNAMCMLHHIKAKLK